MRKAISRRKAFQVTFEWSNNDKNPLNGFVYCSASMTPSGKHLFLVVKSAIATNIDNYKRKRGIIEIYEEFECTFQTVVEFNMVLYRLKQLGYNPDNYNWYKEARQFEEVNVIFRKGPIKKQEQEQFMFFVQCPYTQMIRIGYAQDLKKELARLNGDTPFDYKFLKAVMVNNRDEVVAFRQTPGMLEYHFRSIWYRCTPFVIDMVQNAESLLPPLQQQQEIEIPKFPKKLYQDCVNYQF